MRKTLVLLAGLLYALIAASLAHAADLKGWGVVVLHGKGGSSVRVAPVTSALSAAGAAAVAPRFSWSSGYVTYAQALNEVGGHVAALRAGGAKKIALVGHSLGANVALGYAAQHGGVAAVVAMAPGHAPDLMIGRTREGVQRAKAAIAAGRGSEVGSYTDINQGRVFQVSTSAAAYVSFFDPAGPAVISRNAGAGGAHVLWVVGSSDPNARRMVSGGKVVTVAADHLGTPAAAAAEVVSWLSAQ